MEFRVRQLVGIKEIGTLTKIEIFSHFGEPVGEVVVPKRPTNFEEDINFLNNLLRPLNLIVIEDSEDDYGLLEIEWLH
jgi:hypothetical protein